MMVVSALSHPTLRLPLPARSVLPPCARKLAGSALLRTRAEPANFPLPPVRDFSLRLDGGQGKHAPNGPAHGADESQGVHSPHLEKPSLFFRS